MSGETQSRPAASATVCRSPGNVELNDAHAPPLIRTEAKKGYSVAAAIRTTPMAQQSCIGLGAPQFKCHSLATFKSTTPRQ
jgi:hypothetical protein